MRLTCLLKRKQKKKIIFKRIKLLILKSKSVKTIQKLKKTYKNKLIYLFKLLNRH